MTPPKKPASNKTKPANPERKQRGRVDRSAMFPVAAPAAAMPADYAAWFAEIKSRIHGERLRLVLTSNSVMVMLYWDIGRRILQKQAEQGYGTKVVDRLAADLREAFPEMKGFSPRNLKYMRAFAAAWVDRELVQQSAAQVPWFHNCLLLDRVPDPATRQWYIAAALREGWSRNILSLPIEGQAHLRHGKAQNNFPATLPPADSDMAVQVFKDPYLFDFLGTDSPRREAELERGLVDHIQKFLLELGQGFAFVGRQVHLEIGGDDFYLDLLFYHLKLRRYVVIELKARKFEPGDGAQLGMYMTAGPPAGPPRRQAHPRPAAGARKEPRARRIRPRRQHPTHQRRRVGNTIDAGATGRTQGQPADYRGNRG